MHQGLPAGTAEHRVLKTRLAQFPENQVGTAAYTGGLVNLAFIDMEGMIDPAFCRGEDLSDHDPLQPPEDEEEEDASMETSFEEPPFQLVRQGKGEDQKG